MLLIPGMLWLFSTALFALLTGALVKWIVDRPEKRPDYSPEEMLEELDRVFIPREETRIVTAVEYLPLLLEKIYLTVDSGFPENQVAALLHRIDHKHSMHRPNYAVYPIEIGGVSSDLDVHWLNDGFGRAEVVFLADPRIIQAINSVVEKIPATVIV